MTITANNGKELSYHKQIRRALARISHANKRKGKQDVMSDFENREEANMKIHIGDEQF